MIALYNSIVLRERRLHFGTLDAPPDLSTAVNRVALCASLEYLSLRNHGSKAGFGSAGNRTEAQKRAAREYACEVLAAASPTGIRAYTDGSAIGNPGPCSAGAHLTDNTDPDWQGAEAYAALGPGANNVGELWAIGMALELAEQSVLATPATHTHLHIYTDSQYAVDCLDGGWVPKTNLDLAHGVRRLLCRVRTLLTVEII